ncbi:16S rRNA (cytosine(1402)-N(4))-methyltransferase RsmH [soil metagenome]
MPGIDVENAHKSVLIDETMHFLSPENGGLFVDTTLGLGGHTEGMLESGSGAAVIGIDQDPHAIELATKRLSRFGSRVKIVKANFSQIRQVVVDANQGSPSGILADLGVSSLQLDSESRGFSFRFDAPLDMRMDTGDDKQTVADLLATVNQDELANIIYEFGEERASRKIARWIIEKRENGEPIRTTFELADLVRRAVRTSPKDKIHPATRTFQALRIAVNNELDILNGFITNSVDILKTNGVLAIITFHSLEDRIVKHAFQRLAGKCQCPPRIPQCVCGAAKKVEILTRKPVLPTDAEQSENPRSRSAKFRACRKLEQ